ncbi:MAG: hypothetical protein JW900_13180 [Anaerolineae bacterium]|nr:hypothetical protein [Anaerolineae bacterium]
MKKTKRLTRPQKLVIGVGALILALGLANLVKMTIALDYAIRLPDLPMTVSWEYLAASGGAWAVLLFAAVVGLARFRPWGRWATLTASTLYAVFIWADHLLFDASEYARQTWPRDLLLTVLFLVIVWCALNWPPVRKVFRAKTKGK